MFAPLHVCLLVGAGVVRITGQSYPMLQTITLTCSDGTVVGPVGTPVVAPNGDIYQSVNLRCPQGFAGMSAIDDGAGVRSPGWLRWLCPEKTADQQVRESST
jgi:hypothetical protein